MNSANERRSRRRGEPVIALCGVLAAWVGLRAIVWESPFGDELRTTISRAQPSMRDDRSPIVAALREVPPPRAVQSGAREPLVGPAQPPRSPRALPFVNDHTLTAVNPVVAAPVLRSVGRFAPSVAIPSPPSPQGNPAPIAVPSAAKTWQVDAWAVWRPGTASSLAASGGALPPAYGGSQAGIIALYRLGGGARNPAAYLRVTHAPESPRQTEAAAGVSARPWPRIPVRVQAEARVTRDAAVTSVRPAVLAVSELAPLALPAETSGEAYLQAGWVGGRFGTGFVDGQARIERTFVKLGTIELRAGGGVWGGAQRGVARLDAGPSVTFDLRQAGVPARISADYRMRVAGNARPGDGVAVTLSTGF